MHSENLFQRRTFSDSENTQQNRFVRNGRWRGADTGLRETPTRVVLLLCSLLTTGMAQAGETLYNGIVLPSQWPPRVEQFSLEPMPAPYLENPPAVIPIDVGRQLLVDDFLIEDTTLTRTFHPVTYHPASPVLKPEPEKNSWEKGGEIPTAMTFSDGVWYDPKDKRFKMWYWGGRRPATTCYATSEDGIHWEKPTLDVRPGTNIVQETDRDSSTVWLDLNESDPKKRYKLAIFLEPVIFPGNLELYVSPDGIHWGNPVARSGPSGDRTTFFYNPFRDVWVYSLRWSVNNIRCRKYWECADLIRGAEWTEDQPTFWGGADKLDRPNPEEPDGQPQVYTLDATPYESVLLGLFSLTGGFRDRKGNYLAVGYSRDGFYWDRPDRQAFAAPGAQREWNYDYLQPTGGCCLVVGDKLYFYIGARSDAWTNPGAYRSTGLGVLRRDGFVSRDVGDTAGTLTTRPVRFSGKYLFVNADADNGQLCAEVLDEQGDVIPPFSHANCNSVAADETLQQITWKDAADLTKLAGKPVRFRFTLKNGALYSFWVSPDQSGASHGYVAAGGPGFSGSTDTVGTASIEAAK